MSSLLVCSLGSSMRPIYTAKLGLETVRCCSQLRDAVRSEWRVLAVSGEFCRSTEILL